MSEALDSPDTPDTALLEQLAALDFALAMKVRARAMAAGVPDEINGFSRTYQRLARSLRQTLALKAQLLRQRAMALRDIDPAKSPETLRHKRTARNAVLRVIWNEHERCEDPADLESELDELLDVLANNEDFLHTPAADLIAHLCEYMDLPSGPSTLWASLPPIPRFGDRRTLFSDTS